MRRISCVALAVTSVALLAWGSVSAATGPPALKIPAGFQHWYLVNSMIITKASPSFSAIDGLHHIYVNDIGLPRLMKGLRVSRYPEGKRLHLLHVSPIVFAPTRWRDPAPA